MDVDSERIARDKLALRRRLAALPIEEKLRLLDAMREEAEVIRESSPLEQRRNAAEPRATYRGRTAP